MIDPWIMVHAMVPAMMAAQSAEAERRMAEFERHLAREQERVIKHTTSIEVEARWVEDAPRLEAR